jgi:hypothetical protein
MRECVQADKGRMRRPAIVVCAWLLTMTGCGGKHADPAAVPGLPAPGLAAAKAAVVRAARLRYGNELIEDQLVCNRQGEARVCSISFAPQPSQPSHEMCEIYAVSLDSAGRIQLAPAEGNCYFAGGASGAIEMGPTGPW